MLSFKIDTDKATVMKKLDNYKKNNKIQSIKIES